MHGLNEIIAELPPTDSMSPVEQIRLWKRLSLNLMLAIIESDVEPPRQVQFAALELGDFLSADRYAYPLRRSGGGRNG
jgi:hypothetical protein